MANTNGLAMSQYVPLTIHVPGTLGANIVFYWKAPFDCIVQHISAVSSNNSDATLKIGDSGDDDEIMTATAIGDNGVPVEFSSTNWAATNPTGRLLRGDTFVATLDFDGVAGTAAQNPSIVILLRVA